MSLLVQLGVLFDGISDLSIIISLTACVCLLRHGCRVREKSYDDVDMNMAACIFVL